MNPSHPFKEADIDLVRPPVRRGVGHAAKSVLAFRERFEIALDLVEMLMIGTILYTLLADMETQERILSVISEVFAGVLLLSKFASAVLYRLARRSSAGIF